MSRRRRDVQFCGAFEQGAELVRSPSPLPILDEDMCPPLTLRTTTKVVDYSLKWMEERPEKQQKLHVLGA